MLKAIFLALFFCCSLSLQACPFNSSSVVGGCSIDRPLSLYRPLFVDGDVFVNASLSLYALSFLNVTGRCFIVQSSLLIRSDSFDATKDEYNKGLRVIYSASPISGSFSSVAVRDTGFSECRNIEATAFQASDGLGLRIVLDEMPCFETNPIWSYVLAFFLIAAFGGLFIYAVVMFVRWWKARKSPSNHQQQWQPISDEEEF